MYRVLAGHSKRVEEQLNELQKEYKGYIRIMGFAQNGTFNVAALVYVDAPPAGPPE